MLAQPPESEFLPWSDEVYASKYSKEYYLVSLNRDKHTATTVATKRFSDGAINYLPRENFVSQPPDLHQ